MKSNALDWYTLTTGTNHKSTICLAFLANNLNSDRKGSGNLFFEVACDREEFKRNLNCKEVDGICNVSLQVDINLGGHDEDSEEKMFTIEAKYKGLWNVEKKIVDMAISTEKTREELINFFIYQLYMSIKRHIENQLEQFGIAFPGSSGLPSSLPPDDEFIKAAKPA
jgi:hypothetical protein